MKAASFLFLLFACTLTLFSQTSSMILPADTSDIYSLIPRAPEPVTDHARFHASAHLSEEDTSGASLLDGFIWLYRVFISDADGRNCPFSPSCSEYLVQASRNRGFFTGLLMFADRFTRDANPVKTGLYPQSGGFLIDPPIPLPAL